MTSYELHMTSHPLFMILHHAVTSHPLYSGHHTQHRCLCILCSSTITYSVLIIPHLLYMWHETHYMYDIPGILYDTALSFYDIIILNSWCHIHSIHDSTPTLYAITYPILAKSQLLYLWQDTLYVYDILLSIYDISHGVWMTLQPRYVTSHSQYLCNHTHVIDDITLFVCMKSHPLHVGQHRHCLCHHILSWWRHTIVYMSWHPLCLWHHIQYIWCHTHCVYENTSSISDLKPILSAITSTLYVITPTLSKTS